MSADAKSENTIAATEPVTARQLLEMGEGRRELIRGEVIEMAPAGWEHGGMAGEIYGRVWAFVKEHDLGRVSAAETGFLLEHDPDTVRAPDVAFVVHSRDVDTDKYLPGAPDLAVEVVSPTDSFSHVAAKVRDWLTGGARLVWVVDPRARVVQVHRDDATVSELSGDDFIEGEDVLPGFRLAVRECFLPGK